MRAQGIFEHDCRDERHSQNVFIEMSSFLGIPTGVGVMLYMPDRIIGRRHFRTGGIVLAHHVLAYSSWRRPQMPVSLRPLGARSSHWYMPQMPSTPRA